MAETLIEIRNPDVIRDIRTLAARAGKAEADVIAEAVRARLAQTSPAEPKVALDEILTRIDALPHQGKLLMDADLYDEDGMPI